MITLKKWSVETRQINFGPFAAPETSNKFVALSGFCDSHPRLGAPNSEEKIFTSRIASVKGRVVTTKSGSKYLLHGQCNSEHRKWCESKGYKYTGKNPIDSLSKYWK